MATTGRGGPKRPLAILTGMYERARQTTPGLAPGIRLEERPDLAGLAPMDVAERFRDQPGLVLSHDEAQLTRTFGQTGR